MLNIETEKNQPFPSTKDCINFVGNILTNLTEERKISWFCSNNLEGDEEGGWVDFWVYVTNHNEAIPFKVVATNKEWKKIRQDNPLLPIIQVENQHKHGFIKTPYQIEHDILERIDSYTDNDVTIERINQSRSRR